MYRWHKLYRFLGTFMCFCEPEKTAAFVAAIPMEWCWIPEECRGTQSNKFRAGYRAQTRTDNFFRVYITVFATGTSKPITYLLATLSASIHLLSSNCVGQNDLDSDEILLKSFLIYLCHWFGEESSTMSVHALTCTHLVDQVHVYGPLWTTSASVFENFFHSLVHRLHGTRDEACLLVRNFFTSHLFHWQ